MTNDLHPPVTTIKESVTVAVGITCNFIDLLLPITVILIPRQSRQNKVAI